MSRKVTTEEFISRAKIKHSDFYSYPNTIYTSTHKTVIINCPIHGEFLQLPSNHLRGKGCRSCGNDGVKKGRTKTIGQFKEEVFKKHDYFYNYDEVVYIAANKKVSILCPHHGRFEQTPNKHLSGRGCPKCGKESHWSRTDFTKKAKGRICTFYTIRCFKETEEFYKIGITMNNIKERYKATSKMPYTYEVISEVFGEASFIWDLELSEKRKLKNFHYLPIIDFRGSKTECFTQYNI